MKKLFVIALLCLFVGCSSNNQNNNNCVPFVSVNETVDLNLPQHLNLRIPGNWGYVSGGHQGMIVYNINGTQFKAFERLCPQENPSSCSQMIVENNIRMKCQCSNHEFNILNGSPLTGGVNCFAKEYFVENLNGTVLRITNF